MTIKPLITGILLFIIAHIITFFQLNCQFMWKWFREHEWVMALVGIPISLLYLWATKHTVQGFDGMLWPTRFVGFGIGMTKYALFVSYFFNEGLNSKTIVSLGLAVLLVSIQILWK